MPPSASRGRLRERRRRVRRLFVMALGVVSLLLIAGILYGLHRNAVRVQSVVVSGVEGNLKDDVERIVLREIEGSWGFVIPRNSIFFIPKTTIEQTLLYEVPKLGQVAISRHGFQEIEVEAASRAAVGVWCPSEEDSSCYRFDTDGFLFERAFREEGVRVVAPLAFPGDPLRNTLISVSAWQKIALVSGALPEPVRAITFREPDEVDIILASGTRVTYLFGSEDSARAYIGSTLATSALSIGDLEYIDLRFLPKVYVKRKE